MEANFNYNNKTLAWEVLRCIEQNRMLPIEQYGSRHGHSAIVQASNKKLLHDLTLLLRKPFSGL